MSKKGSNPPPPNASERPKPPPNPPSPARHVYYGGDFTSEQLASAMCRTPEWDSTQYRKDGPRGPFSAKLSDVQAQARAHIDEAGGFTFEQLAGLELVSSYAGALHDPPRTLDEIISAVRTGEAVSLLECRQAVAAFDVLMVQLDLESDQTRLAEWFRATEVPPLEYMGEANNPDNPEAQGWYKAMQVVGPGDCC